MDRTELYNAKIKLQEEISNLLKKFEKDTGLPINDVNIHIQPLAKMGNKTLYYRIDIDLVL